MSKSISLIIIFLLQIQAFSQGIVNIGNTPSNSMVNTNNLSNKESNEYLIIFKRPCLIQQLSDNSQLKSATISQSIKNEHEQFVSDLWKIRKSNSPTLKSTSIPVLKNELYRTINAVIIESDNEEIRKIKDLSYVKTILKNEKIQFIKETISSESLKSAKKVILETTTENGAGVKVGIIDTGIDYKNPALGGGFGPGFKVAGGYDFENNDNDPMDDNGHGTGVSGIIAADGELIGIAPKATIYAYKVSNEFGWGCTNNIFSAIERCVDPNQDLDFTDHVDIINMSIGDYFPLEQQLNILSDIYKVIVSLNMIVCLAAGNIGPDYFIFNQFSVSEDVLSVGSCNSDNKISSFSSRNFGNNNYGIKPDIVAMGENVEVLSLLNKTCREYGTSLSCPVVAGVAALLKQKHKDWTYNQIKSALLNSADDIGFNVMEQGAGKINLNTALNQTTIVFPQTINWGIASENNGIITKTCIVKLFNKSNVQQKYNFDFGKSIPLGIDFKTDVSSLVLNPSDSISVTLNMTLDQSQLEYPDQIPYNYFGRMNIIGTKDSLSIPWTLLRGCEIKSKSDINFSDFSISLLHVLKNGKQISPNTQFTPTNSVVVPPGKYDIILQATEGSLSSIPPDTIKSYFYIKENVVISGQLNLDLSKAIIKNRISFQSVDANGNPFYNVKLLRREAAFKPEDASFDFVGFKSKYKILEPIVYNCNHDEYYINDFDVSENYKLIAGEYMAKTDEKSDFFVTNYEINQEIKDNHILKNLPSSLYPYTFIFYPFPNKKSNYSISPGTYWGCSDCRRIPLNEITKSTLWIDKKNEGSLVVAAVPMVLIKDSINPFVRMFGLIYSYGDSIQIKSLRYNGREEFQTVLRNDTVFVNDGPVFYSLNITDGYNYKYFGCYSYLKGMYGESLDYGFSNSSISIFDSHNKVVYHDKIGKYNDNPYTGSLDGSKIELSTGTGDYFINGKEGKALLKYKLNANPPSQFTSIQSLQFLNNLNQIRSIFKIGSHAKLRLILNGANSANSIKLYFKSANETEWKNRTFSINKNQYNENVLESDISDLLINPNEIDFKIELEDSNDYSMVYTLEPAISVTEKKLYNNLNGQKITSHFLSYPNPTKNFITIKNASGIKKTVVSDLNGKKLIEKTVTIDSENIIVDVSKLSSGVYILTTIGDNGVSSEKILKL